MDTTQTEPQSESQLQLFEPEKEKVEILSVIGDQEKSWSIDKYHLMVGVSIVSVVFIMGGIVWLATGNAQGSNASGAPYPTGELKFSEGQSSGQRTINDLPYPSVRAAAPLISEKASAKSASKTPSPTVTEEPKATPTPTPKPSDPTATPTPTSSPTATPAPTDTPTPTLSPTP